MAIEVGDPAAVTGPGASHLSAAGVVNSVFDTVRPRTGGETGAVGKGYGARECHEK